MTLTFPTLSVSDNGLGYTNTMLNDVNDIAVYLNAKIIKVYNPCAPLVRKRVMKRKSQLSNVQRKLKGKCIQTNESNGCRLYCKTRNKLNWAIREAKKIYFKKTIKLQILKLILEGLFGAQLGVYRIMKCKKCCFSLSKINSYFTSTGKDEQCKIKQFILK